LFANSGEIGISIAIGASLLGQDDSIPSTPAISTAALLFVLVTVAASLPARRASEIPPTLALRLECPAELIRRRGRCGADRSILRRIFVLCQVDLGGRMCTFPIHGAL
jgi:hypothetical protein